MSAISGYLLTAPLAQIFRSPHTLHMRQTITIILLLTCTVLSPVARAASADSANLLWYRQPAVQWTEGLPIGNGRLGAMVFGGVEAERLQINEDTVWAGEKRDRNNPEGAKNLAEVRRLLFSGKPKE